MFAQIAGCSRRDESEVAAASSAGGEEVESVVAGEWSKALLVMVDGDEEIVVGHLVCRRADLGAVDALARLQLTARRSGCTLRLRDVSPTLGDVLGLVGLGELVASVVEVGGQTEGREQLGVEEVVDGHDPSS